MKQLFFALFAVVLMGAGCSWFSTAPTARPASEPAGSGQIDAQGDSGVRGTAMTGPTCPVETMPPQPGCDDRPYQGTFVITAAQDGFETTVTSDAQGNFSIALAPNTYTISLAGDAVMPSMSPQTFTVSRGSWTEITLSLDSGIR